MTTAADGRWSWALLGSVAIHGAAAVVVAGAAMRAAPHVANLADVWSGDALEVSVQPAVAGEEVRGSEQVTSGDVTATAHGAKVVERAPAAHAVRPEAKPAATAPEDPAEALARKILAYRPPSGGAGSTESAPESERTATREAAPRSGGMDAAGAPRAFARAFTRALPAANNADPVWETLPLGAAGSVRVTVRVDERGTLMDHVFDERARPPPAHLERLVERTLLMLRGGRFALEGATRGTETLRVDVTVEQRAAPTGSLMLGFEPPAPGSSGRAYFQLASGRFVEAKVVIEPR